MQDVVGLEVVEGVEDLLEEALGVLLRKGILDPEEESEAGGGDGRGEGEEKGERAS